MSHVLDGSTVETAMFNLGPMDGQTQLVERETDELSVVMTDGQQHRYVRTNEIRRMPDGESAVAFDWAGRYYGQK
jgi:hypothetical protein